MVQSLGLCQFNGRSIIAIDDVFLNEVKAFNYDYNICNKIIKSFVASKFKLLKETKVLVLAGGMYDVSITSYSDGMNDIIEALVNKVQSN